MAERFDCFDILPDVVVVWDHDGRISSWNRAAERAFDIGFADAVGTAIEEAMARARFGLPIDDVRRFVSVAGVWRGEAPLESAGGDRVFDVVAEAVGGEGGEGDCVVLAARDVTKMRRGHDLVRTRESRLRAFMEELSEGIGIIDEDGIVVEWNRANERLFGVLRDDAIGRPFWEIMMLLAPKERRTPARGAQIEAMIRRSLATGHVDVMGPAEHPFERQDGSSGTLVKTVVPIPSRRGFCFGMLTKDITDQREAEREIAFRDEKLAAVFQGFHDIVAFLSSAGEIEHINPAAAEILKRPMSQLVGMSVFDIIHADDREFMASELLSVVERRMDSVPAVGRFTTGDGGHVVLEILGNPIGPGDRADRVVVVARDVTQRIMEEEERDRLKQQLLQAQKMESIGRLAGGIAHDFNNLLTGIISNTSLALLDVGTADPLHPLLYDIATAANSAAGLTRQLLAFSRRQIIEPRVVAPGVLIDNMRRMIERIIGEDVELVTDIPRDVGNIRVDPSQFEQILVNLAVNARDAMPDGGVLRIEVANEDRERREPDVAAVPPAGRCVCLEVTDSGCGMSQDVLSHLFEPFFTTKPAGQGTGLGLATVYGAVQQNGGAIDVASEPGHGTAFRIHFPMVEAPAESAVRPLEGALPTGRESVLLVEDDGVARIVAGRILKRLGYRVISCANGGEALIAAENADTQIDLLMTDVVMPGMSGRELAQRISRIRPGLKILYTSGYTEDVILHDGILDSGIEFLGKPYTLQSVAQKIRQVLDKR